VLRPSDRGGVAGTVKHLRSALLTTVFLSGALLATSSSVASPSPIAAVQWSPAMDVGGLPTHNYLFGSDLFTIACASKGSCSAGGNYALNAKLSQAFVVNETNGVWGKAEPVPGFTRRDASENTEVYVMSCPSAGNCSAGGSYSVGHEGTRIFVVDEKNGVWGRASGVPNSGVNSPSDGFMTAMSCPSAGNCSAGGILQGSQTSSVGGSLPDSGAFVLNETNGVWGLARELSGPTAFNDAGVDSLSCSSVANCSAGGSYGKAADHGTLSFVVNEKNGRWGRAAEIPAFSKLNHGQSELRSLSCGAPGSCSAVGQYQLKSGVTLAYIVDESDGAWGKAFNVPGLIKLNGRHLSSLTTLSCASKGNCLAGGSYGDGSHQVAFIVREKNGTWGGPKPVPGLKVLNKGQNSYVQTVSCVSKGNCAASGIYSDATGDAESFLVNEVGGRWSDAVAVQGLGKLKSHSSSLLTISCGTPFSCSAVGGFSAPNNNGALIVSTKTGS
jgi:hypothetical protein